MEWFNILSNISSILGLIVSCISLIISASIKLSLKIQQINKANSEETNNFQQINMN